MNNAFVWLIMMLPLNKKWLYRLYMRSAHWQRMKQEYKLTYCQDCGAEWNLQLHHKTYYDRKGQSILWRESERHFETLCGRCHRKRHFKR